LKKWLIQIFQQIQIDAEYEMLIYLQYN